MDIHPDVVCMNIEVVCHRGTAFRVTNWKGKQNLNIPWHNVPHPSD